MTDLIKVSANLIPQARAALAATAERDRHSQTDVINRALQLYDFISKEVADGGMLMIMDRDGGMTKVKIL